MTVRKGVSRAGESWISTGTLHERMATPAFDESSSPHAAQRAADQAIEQALRASPGALQTDDGLIYEQSASGGYVVSSAGSLRHQLAAINAAEAAAIDDYKRRYNVS